MSLFANALPSMGGLLLASTLLSSPALAQTKAVPTGALSNVVYNFDVSGISSFGEFGSAGNILETLNIGSESTVVGIGWNVTLESFQPSWLSEIGVTLGSTAESFGLLVQPGWATSTWGTQTYTSSGMLNLVAQNLQFSVGTDGLLRLEFTEAFDDIANAADGRWLSGMLMIEVSPIPEPATYGLMALGLMVVAAAARRRQG